MQISIPEKRLAVSLSSTAMTMKLNNIKGWDKDSDGKQKDLTAAMLPDPCFVTLQDTTQTDVEFIEIDPSTIADSSITILKRGLLAADDGTHTTSADNQRYWNPLNTIVNLGSNPPQSRTSFFIKDSAISQTITGDVKYQGAITHDEHIATRKFVADTSYTGTVDATETVKGIVEIATHTEVADKTGTGSTGAKLVVPADEVNIPTDDEKDALAGNRGTPSSSNTYVTEDSIKNSILLASASDNLKASSDTEVTYTADETPVKKIVVNRAGKIRVKFDAHVTSSYGGNVIVVNYDQNANYAPTVEGSIINQEIPSGSSSYVTYSFDVYINAGDILKMYIGDYVTVRNFRIYFDTAISSTVTDVIL